MEVKPDGWTRADPDLADRLTSVGERLAGRGVCFEVHEASAIHTEPSFSAVERIQSLRRTAVTPGDLARVQDRLAAGAQVLAELQEALGGEPRALAILCALMVRRTIRIDYAAGLHAGAAVSLIS